MNIAQLEFDMRMFTFDVVILANTSYQPNGRSISTRFAIYGEGLVQINPYRAEPEVFSVQKHEFWFFCARKFFCWFYAGHYPFAQNLY